MQRGTITFSKKICMLGTFGVGKTSLVKRYVHDLFDDQYLSTIGVQIYEKKITSVVDEPELKLIIWDLANLESLTQATKNYFKGAAAGIIVCDLTRKATFDEKQIYLNSFLETNPKARLVFVGNKSDLIEDSAHAPDALVKLSKKYKSQHFITSAKTGENVPAIFRALKKQLLDVA